jgi:hypothetical protein
MLQLPLSVSSPQHDNLIQLVLVPETLDVGTNLQVLLVLRAPDQVGGAVSLGTQTNRC